MADGLVDLTLPLNMAQGREWLAIADKRTDLDTADKDFLAAVHLRIDVVGPILWQPKHETWNRLMNLAR